MARTTSNQRQPARSAPQGRQQQQAAAPRQAVRQAARQAAPPINNSAAEEHGQDDDILAALDELDNAGFADTPAVEGFEEVPPDTYQVIIEEASLGRSQGESRRLQITYKLRIICPSPGGDFTNRVIYHRAGIEDETQRGFARSDIERLGLPWPQAKDLPATLEQLLDTYAEVKVVLKNRKNKDTGQWEERTNVYFQRALDNSEVDDQRGTDQGNAPPPPAAPAARGRPQTAPAAAPARTPTPTAASTRTPTSRSNAPAGRQAAPPPPPEPEGDAPDDTPIVNVTFDDKGLNRGQVQQILALAEANDHQPAQYNSKTDLLCDVAEYLGVSGDFDKPDDLIAAVEEIANADQAPPPPPPPPARGRPAAAPARGRR